MKNNEENGNENVIIIMKWYNENNNENNNENGIIIIIWNNMIMKIM